MTLDFRKKWGESVIGRSAKILSAQDRRKIIAVIILQICLGILDLAGVAVIGILGALSVSGVQSRQPGNRVNAALNFLHLADQQFQTQAAILGIFATILLISRTLFSVFFTRKTLYFLSRRGAYISANLISRLLSQSLLSVQARTTQETLYAVTTGVTTITVNVLGTTVSLVSDGSLLLVMSIGLFIVDPTIAISTFAVFLAIGFILYRVLHLKAKTLGHRDATLNVLSSEKIVEVLSSYRESVVRNRRDYYAREIGKLRLALANTQAELAFLPSVSKYVIETTVVIGALLISGLQFIMNDASHAVATLTVFLAAGTRIAPAVLRVQQGAIAVRSSLGTASTTLELINFLKDVDLRENLDDSLDLEHEGFLAEVKINGVTFTYPGKKSPAVMNALLDIPPGKSIAIVGSSGAGKTTLVDVILGVLTPETGKILISNLPPLDAVARWPGAVSYVPQDVIIVNGSIRENVALGYPVELATDELVTGALKIAHLDDYVMNLPLGLDTPVGERGTKISGGQRQRLGIARAMFTKPRLLVLDEATSSLDGETEAGISDAIQELKGSTTVVMIAHRLSTVRNADQIVYMANGNIIRTGTFEEVRSAVPDFDRQAKLMGL